MINYYFAYIAQQCEDWKGID